MSTIQVFVPWLVLMAFVFPAADAMGEDCNSNGTADATEVQSGAAADCNQNGVPDECDLASAMVLRAPRGYTTLNKSQWVAVGDLDGDRRLDLATVGAYRKVSALLADGRGGFGSPIILDVEFNEPSDLLAADLDRDGRAELVTTSGYDGPEHVVLVCSLVDGVSLRIRNSISVADRPIRVSAADLDQDQDPDLVVGHSSSSRLSILLNRGDGTFASGTSVEVGNDSWFAVPADMDLDGHVDLVVPSGHSALALLRNLGDASFERVDERTLDGALVEIVAGDFDDDGDTDLVVPTSSNLDLHLLTTQLDGKIGVPELLRGRQGAYMTVGDFDGDGIDDLAATAVTVSERPIIRVLRGAAAGTLSDGSVFPTGFRHSRIASGDLDGDGDADLAVGSPVENSYPIDGWVFVVENLGPRGSLRFRSGPSDHTLPGYSSSLAVADIDLDGMVDFAVAGERDPGIQVVFQRGIDRLETGPSPRSGVALLAIAAEDMDRDGDPDLLGVGGDSLWTWANDGSGAFGEPVERETGYQAIVLETADLDSDGWPDVVTAVSNANSLSIFRGLGGGDLSPRTFLHVGADPSAVAIADLDRDGRRDLAVVLRGGWVAVLRNLGDWRFESPASFSVPPECGSVVALDLDGDELLDIAVGGMAPFASFLRGRGDGSFAEAIELETRDGPVVLLAADTDRDCRTDLVARTAAGNVWTFEASDSGTIRGTAAYRVPGGTHDATRLADIDQDGDADLVTIQYDDVGGLLLYANDTEEPVSLDCDLDGVPDECATLAFRRGDSNDDGKVDVADAIWTVNALVRGGPEPPCSDAADANDDGKVDLADAIFIIDWRFREGPSPADPFGSCGQDPTPDDSSCQASAHCP